MDKTAICKALIGPMNALFMLKCVPFKFIGLIQSAIIYHDYASSNKQKLLRSLLYYKASEKVGIHGQIMVATQQKLIGDFYSNY